MKSQIQQEDPRRQRITSKKRSSAPELCTALGDVVRKCRHVWRPGQCAGLRVLTRETSNLANTQPVEENRQGRSLGSVLTHVRRGHHACDGCFYIPFPLFFNKHRKQLLLLFFTIVAFLQMRQPRHKVVTTPPGFCNQIMFRSKVMPFPQNHPPYTLCHFIFNIIVPLKLNNTSF